MIQLKAVEIDNVDYYLAGDAGDRIDELLEEISDKQSECDDLQNDIDAMECSANLQEDHAENNRNLKASLRKAIEVLGNLEEQSTEIIHDGKITDIPGFISDIEWELKA